VSGGIFYFQHKTLLNRSSNFVSETEKSVETGALKAAVFIFFEEKCFFSDYFAFSA